jgi:hypothetical protein
VSYASGRLDGSAYSARRWHSAPLGWPGKTGGGGKDARHGAGRVRDRAAVPGDDIWVVHAFQKKSTQGIKTPTREVDLIKDRLKRLKEMLR